MPCNSLWACWLFQLHYVPSLLCTQVVLGECSSMHASKCVRVHTHMRTCLYLHSHIHTHTCACIGMHIMVPGMPKALFFFLLFSLPSPPRDSSPFPVWFFFAVPFFFLLLFFAHFLSLPYIVFLCFPVFCCAQPSVSGWTMSVLKSCLNMHSEKQWNLSMSMSSQHGWNKLRSLWSGLWRSCLLWEQLLLR